MLSPIDQAIRDLTFPIPREILGVAFAGPRYLDNPYVRQNLNIPEAIRQQVITPRIRADFNLLGGIQHLVPLAGIEPLEVDPYTRIYAVPKDRTQGREITEVLHMSFGTNGTYGYNLGLGNTMLANNGEFGRSPVTDGLMNVQASFSPIPQVSTARCRVIAPNTVMIADIIPASDSPNLLCRLENDAELSNWPSAYVPFISQMVEYATKAYIYTELDVKIDITSLFAGQELPKIREWVDKFSDSWQTYLEMRKDLLYKMALLADRGRRRRHISYVVGGGN